MTIKELAEYLDMFADIEVWKVEREGDAPVCLGTRLTLNDLMSERFADLKVFYISPKDEYTLLITTQ